jgi:exopolysaccharide production protein ExoY
MSTIAVAKTTSTVSGGRPSQKMASKPVGDSVAHTDLILRSHPPAPLWKRGLDVACIVLALPIVLPVMIVIGILIKLASVGPAFFRQERVGHYGKRFVCYKFRTMAVNTDPSMHQQHLAQLMGSGRPMVKLDALGDQRLIPMGKLLRATGLDELPQLLNVFRGEMSLVGPRPCLPYEYERYSPWQQERVKALPGLTGLWQVSGKNRTTFQEMIELDISYSRNTSLWLDLQIILRTLPALIVQTQEIKAQAPRRRLSGQERITAYASGNKRAI